MAQQVRLSVETSRSSRSTSADEAAKPELIVFDPKGDVSFEVGQGDNKVSCTVDSRAVIRASHDESLREKGLEYPVGIQDGLGGAGAAAE